MNPQQPEFGLEPAADALFTRVAAIIDQARANVVRSVVSNLPESLLCESTSPAEVFRSPAGLELLGLPTTPVVPGETLEQALIASFQGYLLELDKGFAFVGRNKHIRVEDESLYVDLVFYNFVLKCFVLVDLKIGKLTHGDVGQMDGYVRLFEDRFKVEGDNPTIGLILCSEKGKAIAKYSVLSESAQIFASKYLPNLPSEEELVLELQKERRLIEARPIGLHGSTV